MWSPCRGAPVDRRRRYTDSRRRPQRQRCPLRRPLRGASTEPLCSQRSRVTPTCHNPPETRGGERGPRGLLARTDPPAPPAADRTQSNPPSRAPTRRRSPHRMLRLLHTADVHLGARHADLGERRRAPSASASSRRSGRPSTSRSTRGGHRPRSPATCSTRTRSPGGASSGSRPSSSASPRPKIRTVILPGHARRLRPLVGLPRLRSAGAGRRSPPTSDLVDRALARTARRSHLEASTRSSTAAASRRSGPRTARSRTSTRRQTAARTLEDRAGPRGARDPRPDRRRRGRRDEARRSPRRASTTWRSATGTRRSRARRAA